MIFGKLDYRVQNKQTYRIHFQYKYRAIRFMSKFY